MNKLTKIALALVAIAATFSATALAAEQIGTSCADCPNYSGAFSVENSTGVTLHYSVRWGNQSNWKPITLESGKIETHWYPLGENRNQRVPTPYVRFDFIAGDNRFSPKEYRMEFYAVGYAGFGPRPNTTQPKRYYFRYSADGRTLDLFGR